MSKYFLDCEFIEDGVTIDLISIAIIRDNGDEFYRISTEFNPDKADEFVVENVFPFLIDKEGNRIDPEAWKSREEIKKDLLDFIGNDYEIEFWAWFGAYDWICVAQLFGKMVDLPNEFPMYFNELKMLANSKDNPAKPENDNKHDPRADARWAMKYHDLLKKC